MKATKGRIVFYWTQFAGTHGMVLKSQAAIITEVYYLGAESEEVVDLTAFPPRLSACDYQDVRYSSEPKYGCWSWPPREGA